MAAPWVPAQSVILTVGWQCNQDRFTCKIPYVCTNTLNGLTAAAAFRTWVAATLVPAWRPALAADCWYRGHTLEGMQKGIVAPDRIVAIPGALPGTVAGDSDPQNTSMYGVYYSRTQMAEPGRTLTGKTFVGPCPESKFTKGGIDPVFRAAALANLIDVIGQGFTSGAGKVFKRLLNSSGVPGTDLWDAEVWFARGDVASQRRRERPLL